MQTALDPEQELRKRLQTRLAGGELSTTLGASTSNAPIPSAPFANEAQPQIPPAQKASPFPDTVTWAPGARDPYTGPAMLTNATMPRAGDPAAPPTPAPATPAAPVVPIQPVAPPPTGTQPFQTQGEHEPATPPPTGGSPNPTQPAPPAPPTPPAPGGVVVTPGFRAQVNAAYQQYYHRDATEAELLSHAGNPGGIDAVIEALKASMPAAPGGQGPQNGNFQAWFQSLTNGKAPNSATLVSLEGELNKYGITVLRNAAGIAHKIRLPSGEIVRVGNYFDSAPSEGFTPSWGWVSGGSGASGGAGGGGGAATSTGAAGGTGGAQALTMPTSPFQEQLRALLMERIAAAQQPVDQNAPEIADPLSAGRDEVSRGQDAERKALAERLYASGDLSSSTLPQQLQQSYERNGTALSQLRAGLISKEYTQRHDELQAYMQLAVASGDAELARQLQLEIANLQAAVQREGFGINWAEFIAGLNQRSTLAGLTGQ